MGVLYARVGGAWVPVSSGVTQTYVDSKVTKSGDTMTGALVLPGAPTTALQAATKGYVDSTTVASGGDVMTGALGMGNNVISGLATPSSSDHAATKGYVDGNTFQVTPQSRTWSTVGGANATLATNNGWVFWIPVSCGPCSIDGLGIEVTTAIASSVTRLGIYTSHPSRLEPYGLFYDAGTVASDSTGWKGITFASRSWLGGWMWLAAAAQGTGAPTYRAVTGHGEPWVAFALDQTPPALTYRGWSANVGSGALPATVTPGLSSLGNPKVAFHVP